MKRLIALLVVVLVAAGAVWWLYFKPADASKMYVFPWVAGPIASSKVAEPSLSRIADFDRGSPHRLAILVTDPESGWLGLVRAFRAHGVPITVTEDPAKAFRHKVVLVYPIVSGKVLERMRIQGLAEHVRAGGTVLAFDLAGGGLEELFGVASGVEGRGRTSLTWTQPKAQPEETTIKVAGAQDGRMGAVGYTATTAQVLARFDDGSAAVTCRVAGGRACLMGVDLGAFAARAMNGRGEDIARTYVNAYEPSLDVLVDFVTDLYVAGEPMPWLVRPAPAGKQVSILLSHDIDYTRSVVNGDAFRRMLDAEGVKATFFVQTKYVRDYNDDIFFNDKTLPYMKQLQASGMDVASHTVAHALTFKDFTLGSGHERYPSYMPFVKTETKTTGATVMGELRVSKFLLEKTVGAKVRAFRPGRLSYPFTLPQAMAATGYSYSSSITANTTLTHLPFQLTYDRANSALSPVYEFPVTIEDEEAPALNERFDAANATVAKIAAHNGVAVVLIHPNIAGQKLAFEQRLIRTWKDRAWIGSVSDFGAWWAARDGLDIDVDQQAGGRWTLSAAAAAPVQGVQVVLPKAASGGLRLDLPAKGRRSFAIP